jgi:hypothetical protein
MADNIKIVGQVLDVERINRYTLQDEQLLIPIIEQSTFGQSNDYIEYFVFDLGGNILNSNYNYTAYKLPTNSSYSQSLLPNIEIDPIQDIQKLGYESGELNTRYNIFRKIASEPFSSQLFIQQISTDRTELRVDSTEFNDIQLISIAESFATKQIEVPYYYSVILNFGENKQIVAVNIISEINSEGNASILIKLYEPLPANINLKDTFWIVEEIVNPYVFDLNLDKLITPTPLPSLRGPNFDIDLELKNVIPTQYSNFNQLITSLTGSAYQAVLNALSNQYTNVNVNYSIFNDFIHFSSAESRMGNFMFKIGELETYKNEVSSLTPLTSSNASLINQVNNATASINEIISGFDGFESYLYYTSSSLESEIIEYTLETGSFLEYVVSPYPKSNTTQPYSLYTSSSLTVQNWYNTAVNIAQAFDIDNKDILIDVVPAYIREDEDNYLPYLVFVNMIGQYFDNIWIYIDKITDVWDNDNNLQKGISKDLIYDWLRSFGMKLYNSQEDESVLDYNVGGYSGSVDFTTNCISYEFVNNTNVPKTQNFISCNRTSDSIVINPFNSVIICALSGSFSPLTLGVKINVLGSCYDGDYSPSSSFLNNIPKKDLTLDIYKRLYHNLPYLFKSKGSHGGLQGLINIFGITGSILPIKEYGGTTDFEDLKGYSNDKVYISSNTITGSILSPLKRFENTITSSRDVRSQDLHFVDVSFSPQNQINLEVSTSISNINPTWVLDNYIGYPNARYLDTYPSLSFQKDYWFGQTFTHPNEGFDYNGFIRLIQFFDNSLFKMVKDFTPARDNVWTGVTIKSPILERPKVPEAQPIFVKNQDLEANLEGVALSPIYDSYYYQLLGDKLSYYNGDITGSYINTYADFEEHNVNPYLVNNTVGYVPPGFVSGNTDFILDTNASYFENFFENSDFNTLQNNVDKNLTSVFRKKLIPIYSSDHLGRTFLSYSITGAVELQDSYLSSDAYIRPRYDGVQLYGAQFNTWSLGDNSYGVSPVINYNTKKLGLFTEVITSTLPYKSNIKLKYLVNESGSFTELNQRNRNWEEVQNTFKTGDKLNVSLFNPQQYSNQATTNGDRIIHESGYTYYPIFYGYGSSSFNSNTNYSLTQSAIGPTYTVAFINNNTDLGNLSENFFSCYPTGGKFIPSIDYTSSSISSLIFGSGNACEVWNIFNTSASATDQSVSPFFGYTNVPQSNFGLSYFTGSGPGVIDINGVGLTSSYYEIPNSGSFNFQYAFSIVVQGSVGATYSGSMQLWLSSSQNGTLTPLDINTQTLKLFGSTYNGLRYNWNSSLTNQATYDIQEIGGALTLYNGYKLNVYTGTNATCGTPPNSIINLNSDKIFRRYAVVGTQYWQIGQSPIAYFFMEDGLDTSNWRNQIKYSSLTECTPGNLLTPSVLNYNGSFVLDTALLEYNPGDKVIFRYFAATTASGSNSIHSASLSPILGGQTYDPWVFFWNITGGNPSYLKVIPSNESLLSTGTTICVDQNLNSFYLDPYFSSFYGGNYYFDPLNVVTSASFSTLYDEYGYIGYPFVLEPYDKIIIQIEGKSGYLFEYNIDQISITANGNLYIRVKEDISGYFGNLLCNKYYKVAFLKRIKDETSVFINLVKSPGKTSYGFIIPDNISQNTMNNIDNITANSKTQLIDAGSNVITQ